MIREGFRVVLAGPPNVGKSSLLNALARRDVAIVSEEAGTTRDVIEVRLDLEGLPIVVSDTAGIREAAGKIEQEGIRRTLGRARDADLVLWMVDATNLDAPGAGAARGAGRADAGGGQQVRPARQQDHAAAARGRDRRLGADRVRPRPADPAPGRLRAGAHRHEAEEAPVLTQARHRQQLERCRAALASFLGSPMEEFELRAEDLRRAAQALGRITGAVDVEDVLGEIFGRFCIGK